MLIIKLVNCLSYREAVGRYTCVLPTPFQTCKYLTTFIYVVYESLLYTVHFICHFGFVSY